MRRTRLFALVVTLAAASRSGAFASPPGDPCGDARLINQAYTMVPATVLAVETGDRLQVRVDAGKYVQGDLVGTYAVRLVATEAPTEGDVAERSRRRLADRMLGKKVHILISPFQQEGTPRNVMIENPAFDFADENRAQIAAGMARAVDQGPYDIDWYLRCQYTRAEADAKSKGLGMWAAQK
jgi:endonuclease YncB( thermonuclease family)